MGDFYFYLRLGWEHIMSLDALDHILFLVVLAAVYTLAEWKAVLILVTAFTIGHSATLALSALNLLTVPSHVVEFLIPCTIVFTAVSNLLQKEYTTKYIRFNYFLALFFGLVHGLGFANTLRFILAGDQSLGKALIGFNLGLEAGQVLIVFVLLLTAQLALQVFRIKRRDWVLFLSAAVFSLALQMALQRLPWSADRPENKLHGWRSKSLETYIACGYLRGSMKF
jgi:hypothetical protein